jgi:hypothetical protein
MNYLCLTYVTFDEFKIFWKVATFSVLRNLSCLPPEKDPRKEGDTAMKLHIKKALLRYQRLGVIKMSFADVEANIRQATRTSSMLIHRFHRRHILRFPKKQW